MTEQPPKDLQPVIRTIAMPADTNAQGDIFGGWLMSQMDLAAGSVALRTSRGRAATIAVDAMQFHRPVKVGDEVTLYARLLSVGRTSMKVEVRAWRRLASDEVSEQVTSGIFTFVAIDEHGNPRPVQQQAG
ncbi:acyl-CoA thioesterase [Actibacterium sp. XHP0104]|uniref:acyl-CoA thioesterase n=1 Tax=Actibacterium sp. XHP0104 TaxID=2984335 RepID=UPI0021E97F3A|nr:acyl-CoA thioesterase [Actibacterium sp. XHP0104]MCV2881388.1 acyl-CoA thioesterase [Actibacterium sp. XHP0104]